MDVQALKSNLEAAGIRAYLQNESFLVISGSTPPFPDQGGCFWMTKRDKCWFAGTWAPRVYALSENTDVLLFVRTLLEISERTLGAIPDDFVRQWSLRELNEPYYGDIVRELYQG